MLRRPSPQADAGRRSELLGQSVKDLLTPSSSLSEASFASVTPTYSIGGSVTLRHCVTSADLLPEHRQGVDHTALRLLPGPCRVGDRKVQAKPWQGICSSRFCTSVLQ